MQFITYFIVALWSYQFHVIFGDKAALCTSWSYLEQSLKNEEFKLKCSKDKDCQSLNCSGTAHGYIVNSRLQLYACENPPSIEFEANVPHLNINNFKQRVYHNESISLSKNLNIEFELQRTSKELEMAIFLHYTYNGSLPLLHLSPRIPLANHISFPVDCPSLNISTHQSNYGNKSISSTDLLTKPPLTLSKSFEHSYTNCSITNSSCGPNEICQQISKEGQDGICVCISSYRRDENGKCMYDPSFNTSTESPDHHLTPSKTETKGVSLLYAAVLPIAAIIFFGALVYASIRFRIFERLRRRLRVQVYEHVLLGEEEDDDDDLQNPVA